MNQWSTRTYHILGWLAYAAYILAGYRLFNWNPAHSYWWLLSQLVLRISEFYLCYALVFPRLLRRGRALALLVALLGVAACFIALRYGIEEVLYPAVLGFRNYNPNTPLIYYIVDNLYYSSPALALSGVVWGFEEALRRERESQQLRREKQQAEEAFLRTQINPHFLYNTLNYLYAMAYPVSERLSAAMLRLAEMMRYLLHPSAGPDVSLTSEIEYLHSYIELFRLRFAEKFSVDFEVTGNPAGRRVAPLLLIPFVENAFKHGVVDCAARPVRIRLHAATDEVTLEVENAIGQHERDSTSGIGLANVRRRLELLYPGRHQLRVTESSDTFHTLLELREA